MDSYLFSESNIAYPVSHIKLRFIVSFAKCAVSSLYSNFEIKAVAMRAQVHVGNVGVRFILWVYTDDIRQLGRLC